MRLPLGFALLVWFDLLGHRPARSSHDESGAIAIRRNLGKGWPVVSASVDSFHSGWCNRHCSRSCAPRGGCAFVGPDHSSSRDRHCIGTFGTRARARDTDLRILGGVKDVVRPLPGVPLPWPPDVPARRGGVEQRRPCRLALVICLPVRHWTGPPWPGAYGRSMYWVPSGQPSGGC